MVVADTWRWDERAFIAAWEAGVFGDQRVEMVMGEVWPVSIGPWHGAVAGNVSGLLRHEGWQVTMATLPSSGSLPDPDVWVRRRGVKPVARLGETRRLARWNPGDVALVVEVADTSYVVDTLTKAFVHGATGYAVSWVVHRGGVEVFTDPYEAGYRAREHIDIDGELTVPYAPTTLAVAELLDVDDD